MIPAARGAANRAGRAAGGVATTNGTGTAWVCKRPGGVTMPISPRTALRPPPTGTRAVTGSLGGEVLAQTAGAVDAGGSATQAGATVAPSGGLVVLADDDERP
jgi:hypothetical protein